MSDFIIGASHTLDAQNMQGIGAKVFEKENNPGSVEASRLVGEAGYWDAVARRYSRLDLLFERLTVLAALASMVCSVWGLLVVAGTLLAASVGFAVASYRAASNLDAAVSFRDWTLSGLGVAR
jgi:hypothetical protein